MSLVTLEFIEKNRFEVSSDRMHRGPGMSGFGGREEGADGFQEGRVWKGVSTPPGRIIPSLPFPLEL